MRRQKSHGKKANNADVASELIINKYIVFPANKIIPPRPNEITASINANAHKCVAVSDNHLVECSADALQHQRQQQQHQCNDATSFSGPWPHKWVMITSICAKFTRANCPANSAIVQFEFGRIIGRVCTTEFPLGSPNEKKKVIKATTK